MILIRIFLLVLILSPTLSLCQEKVRAHTKVKFSTEQFCQPVGFEIRQRFTIDSLKVEIDHANSTISKLDRLFRERTEAGLLCEEYRQELQDTCKTQVQFLQEKRKEEAEGCEQKVISKETEIMQLKDKLARKNTIVRYGAGALGITLLYILLDGSQ